MADLIFPLSLPTPTPVTIKVTIGGTRGPAGPQGIQGIAGPSGASAVQRYFNGNYAGGLPTVTPTADAASADDTSSPYNHWIWNGTMWGPPFA